MSDIFIIHLLIRIPYFASNINTKENLLNQVTRNSRRALEGHGQAQSLFPIIHFALSTSVYWLYLQNAIFYGSKTVARDSQAFLLHIILFRGKDCVYLTQMICTSFWRAQSQRPVQCHAWIGWGLWLSLKPFLWQGLMVQ